MTSWSSTPPSTPPAGSPATTDEDVKSLRQVAGTKIPRAMLPVLILLALSAFINFVDRGNLSIAAPMLRDELGFSLAQLGVLLSSFFWTYASFQLVSGWLVDRFDASWVIAAGFFLWSTATAATGFVHSF